MKYYDANSMEVRDTEDEFIPGYSNKKPEIFRGIFEAITGPLIVLAVILQIVWLNVVLHCVLWSFIIALCAAMLVCDIIRKDKKSIFISALWLFCWTTNIVLFLLSYFVW